MHICANLWNFHFYYTCKICTEMFPYKFACIYFPNYMYIIKSTNFGIIALFPSILMNTFYSLCIYIYMGSYDIPFFTYSSFICPFCYTLDVDHEILRCNHSSMSIIVDDGHPWPSSQLVLHNIRPDAIVPPDVPELLRHGLLVVCEICGWHYSSTSFIATVRPPQSS